MTAKKDTAETTTEMDVVSKFPQNYETILALAEATPDAVSIETVGSDLLKAADLEGTPFVVTGVRAMRGMQDEDDETKYGFFYILEAFAKGRELPVNISYGGTGAKDVTRWLVDNGVIEFDGNDGFDDMYTWTKPDLNAEFDKFTDLELVGRDGRVLVLHAAKGFQGSNYEYKGKKVTSWYLG